MSIWAIAAGVSGFFGLIGLIIYAVYSAQVGNSQMSVTPELIKALKENNLSPNDFKELSTDQKKHFLIAQANISNNVIDKIIRPDIQNRAVNYKLFTITMFVLAAILVFANNFYGKSPTDETIKLTGHVFVNGKLKSGIDISPLNTGQKVTSDANGSFNIDIPKTEKVDVRFKDDDAEIDTLIYDIYTSSSNNKFFLSKIETNITGDKPKVVSPETNNENISQKPVVGTDAGNSTPIGSKETINEFSVISGHVYDYEDNPVPHASVRIENGDSCVADSKGFFNLNVKRIAGINSAYIHYSKTGVGRGKRVVGIPQRNLSLKLKKL